MNQTFNIHRFAMMLKLDVAEKGKNYLLMTALYLTAIILTMGPIMIGREYSPFREILHYLAVIMLLLFGTSLCTTDSFSQFSNASTGTAALMVPASRFEKFLSSFVLNQVFVILFIIAFWQFHYFAIDLANERLLTKDSSYEYVPKDAMMYASFGYFVIHAAVFLGSIYFSKAAYIKTAAIALALGILVCVFHYFFAVDFANDPTKLTAFPFSGWKLWFLSAENGIPSPYASIFYELKLPDQFLLATKALVCLLVVMLWTAAYFQMKERQI